MFPMKPVKRIWKKWLVAARIIGNFQSQLILSLFYLIIFSPVALLYKLLADPFNLRKKLKTNFQKWPHSNDDLEQARKQY